MKKTRKKILGLLGLLVVAVMFGIAVTIPDQRASATSTITDKIQVRVVGSVPDVNIGGIVEDAIYTNPNRPFRVTYENVATLVLTLEYTDLNNNVTTEIIDEENTDYEPGFEDYTIKLIKQAGV